MIVDCQSSWPMNCHQKRKLHESMEFVLTFANPSLERGRLYSLSAEPLIFLEMGGLPHSLWSMEKYLGLSKLQIILHRFFTAACI